MTDKIICPQPDCDAKADVFHAFGAIFYQCKNGHKTVLAEDEPKVPDDNILEEDVVSL